jgi:urease accessory protein
MTVTEVEPFLDPVQWSDVLRLPSDFAPYAIEELIQIPAGGPGKTAFLQLHFELRNGKTHLIRNYSAGHQIVRQVHYMDTELDDLAVVFIQNVSAGILQGDRLRVEIKVDEGARALVTTQAATKVFEMHKNYASHRMDITVGKNAYCEVMMDPVIPCKGSRLYNEVNMTVDPTGVLIYEEHLTPGRVAHDESWEFDLLYSRLRCSRPNGDLIVADTNVIAPKIDPVSTPGLFGEYSDMAVLIAVAEGHDAAAIADGMHDAMHGVDEVIGSASVLPSGVGAHARTLGTCMTRTEGSVQACWRAARQQLLGVGVTPIYRTKHGFEPTIITTTQLDAPEGEDDVS